MSITNLEGYRKKFNTEPIEAYLEDISVHLTGSSAKKERVLLGLREELASFAAGKAVTVELLAQTFGDPAEVALSFDMEEDVEEVEGAPGMKMPSKVVPTLLGVLVLLVGVLLGVLLGRGMRQDTAHTEKSGLTQTQETSNAEQKNEGAVTDPSETAGAVETEAPLETSAPMGPSETAAPEGWETMDPEAWGTADAVHSRSPDGPYETAEPATPAE